MKQVEVRVRSDRAETVLDLAERHDALAPARHQVEMDEEGSWDRILVNVPNRQVGPLVSAIEEAVDEAEFVIPAGENIPVHTPVGEVRDQVADVSSRSTLELVLDVHQSVGTWRGMLLYAVVSGVVAAYGVIFGLPFLLTAAMLIAPLGAPVMVCVVGVTLGDAWMLRRGALRFVVSIAVLAAAGAGMGLAYGLTAPTEMMETLTNLSVWSVLLGVAGGAAGAQALVQAERDSLVTATATGFLVAVSLSPPAAVLGLAVSIGRWGYVELMAFLIALTFTGILVGGWAALRFRGVRPGRPSAERGHARLAHGLVLAAALALVGLVAWQGQRVPEYRKADRAREATELVREAVAGVPGYRVLASTGRFTTGDSDWHSGEELLLRVTLVREAAGVAGGGAAAEGGEEEALKAAIRQMVTSSMEGVRPFVDLSILSD